LITENDIVNALAKYLVASGWEISQQLTTRQRGIDLIATRPGLGRLLIESKGGTSADERSNRHGKPFSPVQIVKHVSVAFYYVAKLQSQYPNDQVAMALPADHRHRAAVLAIEPALTKLGIKVYFVDDQFQVHDWKNSSSVFPDAANSPIIPGPKGD
jgi:hypothetical protein